MIAQALIGAACVVFGLIVGRAALQVAAELKRARKASPAPPPPDTRAFIRELVSQRLSDEIQMIPRLVVTTLRTDSPEQGWVSVLYLPDGDPRDVGAVHKPFEVVDFYDIDRREQWLAQLVAEIEHDLKEQASRRAA